jgi:NADPH-dependent glutamate synthase beta subunit-like oxidoreductase
MSLLKKSDKVKPLRSVSRGGAGGTVSALRPRPVEKMAPCLGACPAGNDVRAWVGVVAQRAKTGLPVEAALDEAWRMVVARNPLPSVMGRVCPHPCEEQCNRKEKDGAVAVNSLERYLGDWGVERGLGLPVLAPPGSHAERIAVVGAGPAGLSCAYQLARRGYPVTVFEGLPEAGGMLRYGIPDYRLPRAVLDAEIRRIAALGVELRCNTAVGKDVGFDELRQDFAAVFLAVGAHRCKRLGVPGEEGPGVHGGTDFLRQVSLGRPPAVGRRVAVIGGGDTAVDAARVCLRLDVDAAEAARRLGAEVTIFYRRTRTEMPAIEPEVVGALEEGVRIEFLAAPAEVVRGAKGEVVKLVVQRMRLGEPDSSGRRAPVPIDGELIEHECDTVIAAVSQQPDFASVGGPLAGVRRLEADAWGRTSIPNVWSGGDDVNLGLATIAVGQGRKAAESIDATLRGEELVEAKPGAEVALQRLKMDFYEAKLRANREVLDAETRLAQPHAEIDHGIRQEQALEEAARCFSCGLCLGCERCWMYCTPACFSKAAEPHHGGYYDVKLDKCDGCKKCAEECPCGFLDMV